WRRSGSCRARAAPPAARDRAPAWPSRRPSRPRRWKSRLRSWSGGWPRVARANENLGAVLGAEAAVGKLARQPQLARGGLPADLLLALALEALLGLVARTG